jgi:hypothetical protein
MVSYLNAYVFWTGVHVKNILKYIKLLLHTEYLDLIGNMKFL